MNYNLERNATVEVIPSLNGANHPVASIIVNDKFRHDFAASSRVSKTLELMSADDLAERLTGGHFFFVDDELYDFRDGRYAGFVHTDDSIDHLADVVGITKFSSNSKAVRVYDNVTANHMTLGSKWSDHNIVVPAYQDGGEFQSELHFGWNPFVKTINSAFMLYRLICTNGMRGLRSFMNTRIPLVNRWEEHLEIANTQIQNKVNSMVIQRMTQMGRERATVAELANLERHASDRLKTATSQKDMTTLENIMQIASPHLHLGHVYRGNVFEDKNLAARHAGHLSVYDAYNMATELRSHTTENDKSTDRALDKLSNDLVFERNDITRYSQSSSPTISSFSDPEAAFFGQLH